MVDGGYDCINRSSNGGSIYAMQLNSTITKTGKIESWCTYMDSSGSVRLRIYRLSGSQYLYIGGATASCAAGYQAHSANIDVQSGDIVGIYRTSGSMDVNTAQTSYKKYKTGSTDVTYDTPTSDWNDATWVYVWSMGVTVTVTYDDYYVKTTGDDSKDGGSWANAWKTINKAATTVPDGKTVHIGFGTYDAEPAANKIAPQNIGASGIYYLPETATTGGGTGTVSVEQNT